MSKSKSNQTRRICGVTYLDESTLLSLIESKSSIIKNFSFITHDKDIYDSGDNKGQLKVKHIHFIILLYYPYPLSTLRNWFKGYEDDNGQINTLVEVCNDIVACYRYFTHIDNPDKYQYNEDDIICGDPCDFNDDIGLSSEDNAWIGLEMLLLGKSRIDIAKRLGRDFIYHYGHIKQIYDDIIKENLERGIENV